MRHSFVVAVALASQHIGCAEVHSVPEQKTYERVGLTWLDGPQRKMSFEDAAQFCASYGFRIPNHSEMAALYTSSETHVRVRGADYQTPVKTKAHVNQGVFWTLRRDDDRSNGFLSRVPGTEVFQEFYVRCVSGSWVQWFPNVATSADAEQVCTDHGLRLPTPEESTMTPEMKATFVSGAASFWGTWTSKACLQPGERKGLYECTALQDWQLKAGIGTSNCFLVGHVTDDFSGTRSCEITSSWPSMKGVLCVSPYLYHRVITPAAPEHP